MKTWKTAVTYIAVALVAVSIFATVIYYAAGYKPLYNGERITINGINATGNTIFVNVTANNFVINISKATITDKNNIIVAVIPINTVVQKYQTATLMINTNATLASGEYVVGIETNKGSTFGTKLTI